jgi:hypothetical protein
MGSFYPKMVECSSKQLDENIKNWTIAMADVDYHASEIAVMKLVRSFTYDRVKVADIMQIIREIELSGIPCAEKAWEEVLAKLDPYRRPEWSHTLIQEAVRVMGYVQLCMSESPSFDRAQFIKIYNNLRQRKCDDQENSIVARLSGGNLKMIG